MKFFWFLLLCPLLSWGFHQQCNDLKEGIFTFETDDGNFYTIVRSKDKQRENVAESGVVSEFDIKWVSDCSYILFNRRLVLGKDLQPDDYVIDTLYNDITSIAGDEHTVVSYIKQIDFFVEATIRKRDTSLLFNEISDLEKFINYDGPVRGGILIGNHHAINYKQHRNNKTDFLIAFLEVLTIDHFPKYQLLDFKFIRVKLNEEIAAYNCMYDGVDNKEIFATYTSNKGNNVQRVTNAWRFNKSSRKIEKVSKKKVRIKKSESNDIFIPFR